MTFLRCPARLAALFPCAAAAQDAVAQFDRGRTVNIVVGTSAGGGRPLCASDLPPVYSQTTFGRPYVVAPEVPPERVQALRAAFMATMRDPELQAEARRIQVDVDAIPGEALQRGIAQMYATPQALIEKARHALAPK
jgi:tripartite-type tricarboxylate transporter receptor subunit TctC